MGKVLVIGSLNMDIVQEITRHPQIGETIKSKNTDFLPGGKGANQAIAAAKSGSEVAIVGAVGNDSFGDKIIDNLRKSHVNVEFVSQNNGSTGMAIIHVDESGENSIVLSGGENENLQPSNLPFLKNLLPDYDIVLLQNEIPWASNQFVIDFAYEMGKEIYLNLAPGMVVGDEVLEKITLLILNETEAEILSGLKVTSVSTSLKIMEKLIERGLSEVIITLGENGSVYLNRDNQSIYTPAFRVDPVDTTAAGDTFIGAYITARLNNVDTEGCLEYASAAASLCVTKRGAQQSIPTKEEIEMYLNLFGSR
ncbi:ribokinase [Fredinandcohnia humi]